MPFGVAVRLVVYGESLHCKNCCAPCSLKLRGAKNPLRLYCSHACYAADHTEVTRRRATTNLARHGYAFPAQNPASKEKRKQTCQSLYGFDHSLQVPEIRAKIEASLLDRFGVVHTFLSPSIRQKSRDTIFKRYGVDHVMKVPEIAEKAQNNGRRKRKSVRIGGKLFSKLQGYEPHAIRWLVERGVNPECIRHTRKEVPSIPYTNTNKRDALYYPDLKIGKHLIEVKSTWTAGVLSHQANSDFENNKLKAVACIAAGYKFTLLLVFKRGSKWVVLRVDDLHIISLKELSKRYRAKLT